MSPAVALLALALAQGAGESPGPTGLAPFPRTLHVAVMAWEGLEPSEPVQRAVTDYYQRVSRGRFFVRWTPAGSFSTRRDLDVVRIGSDAEIALTRPWVREALVKERKERFDAVCLLVPRRGARRDRFRWPHQGSVMFGRRRVPYYVAWADAGGGETLGVHAHELGHLAGLQDEYEHQSVEEGRWCVMSRGYRSGDPPGSDPAPACAPCRLRLGWIPKVRVGVGRVDPPADGACLLVGEELVVERRGERLLVWRGGRLAGTLPSPKAVAAADVSVDLSKDGRLEVRTRPRRQRKTILGE